MHNKYIHVEHAEKLDFVVETYRNAGYFRWNMPKCETLKWGFNAGTCYNLEYCTRNMM